MCTARRRPPDVSDGSATRCYVKRSFSRVASRCGRTVTTRADTASAARISTPRASSTHAPQSTDRAKTPGASSTMSAFPDAHDLLALLRRRDHSDRARHHARLAPDPLRERHLIARPELDLLLQRQAARRAVDQVHAHRRRASFASATESSTRPPARRPIRRGDAQEQRQLPRPRVAHRLGHLQRETRAIFEAAAVLVRALLLNGERNSCAR